MDYEKAYKEALERARSLQHDNCWVTSIFPELRESEDERVRQALISAVKKYDAVDGIEQEKVLAWLEKQKEEKPAEWSEEDEKIKNVSIAFLEEFKEKGYENAMMCIDWLKSLRPQPHWKPSDEQRYWLALVIDLMGNKGRACLKSLYNDLKKL